MKTKYLPRCPTLLFLVLLPALALPVSAYSPPTFSVAPNSSASTEGSTNASYPFGTTTIHYQQVYAASQFPAGGWISEVSFRPDGTQTAGSLFFPVTLTSVKIILSTTSKAPGGLSTTFANNLGTDKVTVFNSNTVPFNLSTSHCGSAGGPYAFDCRVRLTTHFNYNPALGNLIMDVVLTNSNAAPPNLDAVTVTSNPLSSRAYALSSTATTATTLDNKSLVTQFTFGKFGVATASTLGWIIGGGTITDVRDWGGANNHLTMVNHFFNNADTLIIGSPGGDPRPAGFSACTPLCNHKSFAQFQSDLLAGAISPVYAGGIMMYDNEKWAETPTAEQTAPKSYMALFANLAHAYGYSYLAAPAQDLVTGLNGYDNTKTLWQNYINIGFPGYVVDAPADVYDIQAQSRENKGDYETFVSDAFMAAGSPNPLVFFAGVTTSELDNATAQSMYDSVVATFTTHQFCDGYWLNRPATTNFPNGDTQMCVDFLTKLMNNGY
jgi:hypothetical protein